MGVTSHLYTTGSVVTLYKITKRSQIKMHQVTPQRNWGQQQHEGVGGGGW